MVQRYLVYVFLIIWPFQWLEKRSKSERSALSLWDTNPWSNFCDSHWELICRNKQHPGTPEISKPQETPVETHFYVWHGTHSIPALSPTDGDASWLLLSNLVCLLSERAVQSESAYSCIATVTGQVWVSQKVISISINNSYYQCSSPEVSLNWNNNSDEILTNPLGKYGLCGWLM